MSGATRNADANGIGPTVQYHTVVKEVYFKIGRECKVKARTGKDDITQKGHVEIMFGVRAAAGSPYGQENQKTDQLPVVAGRIDNCVLDIHY